MSPFPKREKLPRCINNFYMHTSFRMVKQSSGFKESEDMTFFVCHNSNLKLEQRDQAQAMQPEAMVCQSLWLKLLADFFCLNPQCRQYYAGIKRFKQTKMVCLNICMIKRAILFWICSECLVEVVDNINKINTGSKYCLGTVFYHGWLILQFGVTIM